jgi:FKBP-type peptidyl-prolyl cis-trans isomerase SlyD|tara:strand:- start:1640 stop:2185 length:546 start_codon:yes stop_codon:yes gene_type:complete
LPAVSSAARYNGVSKIIEENPMPIEKNQVVLFHYSVRDEQDNAVEDSHGGEPNAYLHGHGGIIKGLEEALEGRDAGDTFSVTVTPDKAYGPRKPDAIQRVPIKHLMGAKRWKAGMVAQVQTEQGPRHVVVAKVGHKFADVDTNHPMAGRTLTFDIEVIDVRAATSEEIAHGHAHGPGGHHH